jgi:hypothetical protein
MFDRQLRKLNRLPAEVLKRHGHSTPAAIRSWLEATFPQNGT